jgi:bis(5'-nucleosyl)-tetraphosphatase (symmetrical)
MASYVVGDIQGCYDEFLALLDQIHFSEADELWLVGDLVNRGAQSLAVLRFLKKFQGNLRCVLGNHDLHLLAAANGARQLKSTDTFTDILAAADRDELLFWLRQQPLIHYSKNLNTVMAHAGIYPFWSLSQALEYADELHQVLIHDDFVAFLSQMYADVPSHWNNELSGYSRYRFIVNAFTRMRAINADDSLNLTFDGALKNLPQACQPWFKRLLPEYQSLKIVFGHWAALLGETNTHNVYALDTGCVWGEALTAMRLEDGQRFFVDSTILRK